MSCLFGKKKFKGSSSLPGVLTVADPPGEVAQAPPCQASLSRFDLDLPEPSAVMIVAMKEGYAKQLAARKSEKYSAQARFRVLRRLPGLTDATPEVIDLEDAEKMLTMKWLRHYFESYDLAVVNCWREHQDVDIDNAWIYESYELCVSLA